MSDAPVFFDKLDRSSGNGSANAIDDVRESESYEQPNRFATSWTKFDESDVESNRSKWERLSRTNDHRRKGEDTSFFRRAERLQDAMLFCDILELANPLREEVLSVVEEFDFDSNKYSKPYEKLILVIINLLHDRTLTQHDSFEDRIIYDERYEELMEHVGLGATERQRLRRRVRESSDIVE